MIINLTVIRKYHLLLWKNSLYSFIRILFQIPPLSVICNPIIMFAHAKFYRFDYKLCVCLSYFSCIALISESPNTVIWDIRNHTYSIIIGKWRSNSRTQYVSFNEKHTHHNSHHSNYSHRILNIINPPKVVAIN